MEKNDIYQEYSLEDLSSYLITFEGDGEQVAKFKYFYVSAENGNIEYWQFLLDNAYYGNKYICEKNKVIISLKQYFIYVPFYIKSILDNDFFKELTEKKFCEIAATLPPTSRNVSK